jgi:hypothetical protein
LAAANLMLKIDILYSIFRKFNLTFALEPIKLELNMAKEKSAKKEEKKAPAKDSKEKKAAKDAKKAENKKR